MMEGIKGKKTSGIEIKIGKSGGDFIINKQAKKAVPINTASVSRK